LIILYKTCHMARFRKSIFLVLLILTAGFAFNQEKVSAVNDPWPGITAAFQDGNARSLAENFNSMVDLGLPDEDNSYSKSQGEIVMRDFFKKSPPVLFEVKQTGKTNEKSHFAICQYESSGKKYQVSIFLTREANSYLITRIKFEKQ
jgi:hypothetical protein